MYQDRTNDLDPRVNKVLNEGPKILKAIKSTNDILRGFYDIKNAKHIDCLHVGVRPILTFENTASAVMEWIDPDEHPKDWDYSKKFKETLTNLNESVLDAYITFLECEREALIKRWNSMAKSLKK